ncbi:MAG: cytochrome C, partial [Gammaproteobacteria bacterium]
MKSGGGNTRALCGAALLLSVLTAPAALAVPSFARQTGMACEACHTVYPELTHFGRVFKANGYVLANLKQ